MSKKKTKVPPFVVDPSMKSSFTMDDIPQEVKVALSKELHVVLPNVGLG